MRRVLLLAVIGASVATYLAIGLVRPAAPTASPPPSTFGGAYRLGSCATTPEMTWGVWFRQNGRLMPGAQIRQMVVGGHLATPPTRNLTVGAYWYVAGPPQPSITLRATRLDRDAPPFAFEAVGYATNEIYPDAWDRGWYYRTSVAAVEAFPTPAGCWKVHLLGGREDDVLVLELRGLVSTR